MCVLLPPPLAMSVSCGGEAVRIYWRLVNAKRDDFNEKTMEADPQSCDVCSSSPCRLCRSLRTRRDVLCRTVSPFRSRFFNATIRSQCPSVHRSFQPSPFAIARWLGMLPRSKMGRDYGSKGSYGTSDVVSISDKFGYPRSPPSASLRPTDVVPLRFGLPLFSSLRSRHRGLHETSFA